MAQVTYGCDFKVPLVSRVGQLEKFSSDGANRTSFLLWGARYQMRNLDIMGHVIDNLRNLQNYKTASALHESSFKSAAQEAFLDINSIPSNFNSALQ
ncbi:unnamed protein product [Nezara viridula]|uniref:Uncharacterized protein n=1 Tax=Nezara viridula TaxID=85310 RepID=A0A9P0H397_NEZVI|nr:unnamed protein product [Nezara viridula]